MYVNNPSADKDCFVVKVYVFFEEQSRCDSAQHFSTV